MTLLILFIDPLFWAGIGVNGLVPDAQRGRVTGRASGIPSSFSNLQVVGFSNSAAQYWYVIALTVSTQTRLTIYIYVGPEQTHLELSQVLT